METTPVSILFENDKFHVAHHVVGALSGYEIYNKDSFMLAFLVEREATEFEATIRGWQAQTPTEEEVELKLDGFTFAAQHLRIH